MSKTTLIAEVFVDEPAKPALIAVVAAPANPALTAVPAKPAEVAVVAAPAKPALVAVVAEPANPTVIAVSNCQTDEVPAPTEVNAYPAPGYEINPDVLVADW